MDRTCVVDRSALGRDLMRETRCKRGVNLLKYRECDGSLKWIGKVAENVRVSLSRGTSSFLACSTHCLGDNISGALDDEDAESSMSTRKLANGFVVLRPKTRVGGTPNELGEADHSAVVRMQEEATETFERGAEPTQTCMKTVLGRAIRTMCKRTRRA